MRRVNLNPGVNVNPRPSRIRSRLGAVGVEANVPAEGGGDEVIVYGLGDKVFEIDRVLKIEAGAEGWASMVPPRI